MSQSQNHDQNCHPCVSKKALQIETPGLCCYYDGGLMMVAVAASVIAVAAAAAADTRLLTFQSPSPIPPAPLNITLTQVRLPLFKSCFGVEKKLSKGNSVSSLSIHQFFLWFNQLCECWSVKYSYENSAFQPGLPWEEEE